MLILATGGTIDKMPRYLEDGKTFDNASKIFDETHLPEMLDRIQFLGEHTIRTLYMIDSLEMNEGHRAKLTQAIIESEDDQIIVTHGTDTMPKTAFLLQDNRKVAGKTIVLTGAMLPYSIGEHSDALENLSAALTHVQNLDPNVYISMDGDYFTADNVWKDTDEGRFKRFFEN